MCFQRGEGHLNGREFGGVWRQVKEPAPHIPQNRRLVVICGEVVATEDSSGLQFRNENVLDIAFKDLTIHYVFDDPRRDQIVMHQACNERWRFPRTKRGIHFQAGGLEVLLDRTRLPELALLSYAIGGG